MPYFPRVRCPINDAFITSVHPALLACLRGEKCSHVVRSIFLMHRRVDESATAEAKEAMKLTPEGREIVVQITTVGKWPKREWYPFPELGDTIHRSTVEEIMERLVSGLLGVPVVWVHYE